MVSWCALPIENIETHQKTGEEIQKKTTFDLEQTAVVTINAQNQAETTKQMLDDKDSS